MRGCHQTAHKLLILSSKMHQPKILLPCFSVTGMAPEDKHIAVSWVGVAYTGMLCVCLGGNAVLRRAEFANCTSVQMVSACVLGAVVVLCAVVSCCSSVVSCGCLVFRNTQVHSCFLSPHLSRKPRISMARYRPRVQPSLHRAAAHTKAQSSNAQ